MTRSVNSSLKSLQVTLQRQRESSLVAAGAYIYLSFDDTEHLPPEETLNVRPGAAHLLRASSKSQGGILICANLT